MKEHVVQVADLEALRDGLDSVLTHLQSVDIANAAKNLSPEVNYSPLTLNTEHLALIVTGYLEEVAIAIYEDARANEPKHVVRELDFTEDDDDVAEPDAD